MLELLAHAIREDENVDGIKFNNQSDSIKQVSYADDFIATVSNLKSARQLLKVFNDFEKFSGLKLNVDKTEAMWIGSQRGNNKKPLGLKWTNDSIRSLGVSFTYDHALLEKENFQDKLAALRSVLNIWKMRDLTIMGRILIVKTLSISKFVYLASLIPFPDHVIQSVEKLIYSFVWKGKRDKVKRKALIGNFESDGL